MAGKPHTGKKPHNGPASGMAASGIPASGIPASGIPATGMGWGGPARGASDRPAQPFAPGNAASPGCLPTYKSLARAARIEALKELQWRIAHEGENEAVRLAAADKLLDREEGKPIQREIKGDLGDLSGLSEEEIDARMAAIQAKLAVGA